MIRWANSIFSVNILCAAKLGNNDRRRRRCAGSRRICFSFLALHGESTYKLVVSVQFYRYAELFAFKTQPSGADDVEPE